MKARHILRGLILIMSGLLIFSAEARVTDPSIPLGSSKSYGNETTSFTVRVERVTKNVEGTWKSLKDQVKSKLVQWFAEPKQRVPASAKPLLKTSQEKSSQQKKSQQNLAKEDQAQQLMEEVLPLDGETVSESKARLSAEVGVFSNSKPLSTIDPGRLGDKSLKRSNAGVPKVNWTNLKVDRIKVIDIGEEPKIKASELAGGDLLSIQAKYGKAKALKSPDRIRSKELSRWLKVKIGKTKSSKSIRNNNFGLGQVVSHRKIDELNLKPKKENLNSLLAVEAFNKSDVNMLGALILYQKRDRCHVVIGLFSDLVKSAKYGKESEFYLGACAHKMGFYSEAVHRLVSVVKRESIELTGEAISLLLKKIPKEYDALIARTILDLKNKKLVKESDRNLANYLMARISFQNGDYVAANKFAALVSKNSAPYYKAQYLLGVTAYSTNQLKRAERILVATQRELRNSSADDGKLASLVSISLGRIRFNQGRYKEALSNYSSIKKDHPLWIDGLIEQGWTQLQMGDYAGAIGNMYSLHSPYFKAVFMPESHVIRTIGYLNICQFGDAYRTLSHIEKENSRWAQSVSSYINKQKLAKQYYETVKKYLRGQSEKDTDGLPYQVIREMSRQKDFLNFQAAINEKIDEIGQYKFITGIIKRDKAKLRVKIGRVGERITKLRKKIKQSKIDKRLVQNLNIWKASLRVEQKFKRALKFELALYERGRQGYLGLQVQTEKRFKQEKYQLREKAARSLVRHLRRIKGTLSSILSNNEMLRYEIFAGSGENIRYQVAGGKSVGANRLPASIKPSKSLNWDFAGEYWADEIGSYRSSLKNNCPKVMGKGGGATGYKKGNGV